MQREIIDELQEHLNDEAIYFPAEFDPAILGHSAGLVVYDEDKIIEILMEERGDYIEAREWFDFNMSQLGDGTPIFVRRPETKVEEPKKAVKKPRRRK